MSRLVIIESPYAGDVEANVAYARLALRDSLMRGEAPFASHLLYTQPGVLNDDDPTDRQHGILSGLAWGKAADATAVYFGRGISRGMAHGIAHAWECGRPVEWRLVSEDGELAEYAFSKVVADLIAEVERLSGRRRPEVAAAIHSVADALEKHGDHFFDGG